MSSGCLLVLTLLALSAAGGSIGNEQELARQALIDEIRAEVRLTSRHIGKKSLDPRVMEVMALVPRHEFVPIELRRRAYDNRPLPIGYGQTISQPYIVALMTDLLRLEPGQSVLEVGTGSGYQAAVLSAMSARVFSIEIIPELGKQAEERLRRLQYEVTTRIGDGYYGWVEEAPFDAIIVTAAATHIPPPLIQQLKPGGVMVIPVGGPFTVQQLTLLEKDASGKVQTRQVLPVAFVPLTGGR